MQNSKPGWNPFQPGFFLWALALPLAAEPALPPVQEGPGYRRWEVKPEGEKPGFTLLQPHQTGVSFTNHLSDAALARNQILEVGSGVALGDVDGDGWTDIYFCSIEGTNRLYRNLGNWRFEDVTERSGVGCASQHSTGAVLADIDGDNDLDLLVTAIGQGARAFINDGRGGFQEEPRGLSPRGGSTSLALADVNGDGWLDLYVANYHTKTVKDSPEINVSVRQTPSGLQISPPGMFLPLYLKNGGVSLFERGESDRFYLNDGRGHFKAVDWKGGTFQTAEGKPLSEEPKEWTLAVMFRDLNHDGAPDIYVCNDFFNSPDYIWLNDGSGQFKMAPPGILRHTSMSSMAVDFSDLNRDGLDDFLVLDMFSREHSLRHRQRGSRVHIQTKTPASDPLFRPEHPRNTLFLQRPDRTYAEIAAMAGLDASEWSWSVCFLDVDLDGFEDALITNGNLRNANDADSSGKGNLRFGKLETRNLAFRNQGDLTFEDNSTAWGFDLKGVSHGMALGDLDKDGDLDVVVNNMSAPASLYRNNSPAPRIAVRLKGAAPNTRGIGARVALRGAAIGAQSQEVISGGRYLSGDDGVRMFAAPSSGAKLTLEVVWRHGTKTTIENAVPNSIYEISATGAEQIPKKSEPFIAPLFEQQTNSFRFSHHQSEFDDWLLQPLLPRKVSTTGPAVGWFDLDQDGREDLLVGNGRGGNQVVFLNTPSAFRPMRRAEVLSQDQSGVLGWRDRSGAKLLVAFSNYQTGATNHPQLIEYDLQQPGNDQVLTNVTSSAGPLALGVLNRELALFVGSRGRAGNYPSPAPSRLFLRKAGKWQIDPASDKTLAAAGLVNGAAWADLEGDGFLELLLACEWGPIRVYSTKSGALEEITASLGLDQFTGLWNGVATGDFDRDGHAEIVASNWGRNSRYEGHRQKPIRLYYGDWNGDGRTDLLEAYYEQTLKEYAPFLPLDSWREAAPDLAAKFQSFSDYSQSAVEAVCGVTNPQFLEMNILETVVFWRSSGKFTPRPLPLEAQTTPAFGIAVGDANGDCADDLFLTQNFFGLDPETPRQDSGQGLWLMGDGKGDFKPLSSRESGVALLGEGRGCALADFDNDGRLDLAVGQNAGPFALFRNTGGSPGVRVRLQGPPNNPEGIGATVRVEFENGWGPSRTVQIGSGYWSQSSVVSHFGMMGKAVRVQVRWPGGKLTEHLPEAGQVEITARYE